MPSIRNFLAAKKVLRIRSDELSRFSLENFSSQVAERFHRGILQCFNIIVYPRILTIRERVRVSQFSVEHFLSHSAKTFLR